MNALERWAAWPWWLRWPALYLVAAMLASAVGAATFGVGNALFVAGALLILASLGFLRTGGARSVVVSRDIQGRKVKELVPKEKRDREIARGVALFLVGVALWASALVPYFLGRPL